MPLIIFGTVALAMIMIPMGFQFLAVLGGKALLLAKMALILTSIQGLKKIASSNINYGLYHAPEPCKYLAGVGWGCYYFTNIFLGHYQRHWPVDGEGGLNDGETFYDQNNYGY